MDYPKNYTIVRQGRAQVVSVADLDELIALRTELELICRFGAGATNELIAALDRRIAQAQPQDSNEAQAGARCEGELEEMRAILCDSLAPANRQAIAQIDRDCPQARAGVTMQSIENDTKEFRDDVADQLANSEVDDVDSLLAAFEQADKETSPEPSAPAEAGNEALEADLEALLASVAADPDSSDADLAQLAASIDALQESEPAVPQAPALEDAPVVGEVVPSDAVDQAAVAPEAPTPEASAPVESAEACDPATTSIETVTEHVSETLNNAEAQLDAIASAFEVAAAELGQISSEVAQAAPQVLLETPADAVAAQTSQPESQSIADVSMAQMEEPVAAPAMPAVEMPRSSTSAPRTHSEPVTCASSPKMAGQLRGQLQQARANILSELDDLLVMIDRVDQMQSQADQAVRKAREFEQAAARAQQANLLLAGAEAEAAKARAAFEQAQSKVNGAREAWESAQRDASLAAAGTRESGL